RGLLDADPAAGGLADRARGGARARATLTPALSLKGRGRRRDSLSPVGGGVGGGAVTQRGIAVASTVIATPGFVKAGSEVPVGAGPGFLEDAGAKRTGGLRCSAGAP